MKSVQIVLLGCFLFQSCITSIRCDDEIQFKNLYKPGIPKTGKGVGGRIIGGQEAARNSIPYQVFLKFKDLEGKGWYCGGSLIKPDYVLTAGHCGFGSNYVEVYLGAHKPLIVEPTQKMAISNKITVHEDYNGTLIINDIALIKLSTPIVLSTTINTVKLPASSEVQYAGKTARISGWGLTNGFSHTISPVLEYVNVKVISNEECGSFFEDDIRSSIMCTSGDQLTGSCNGDSGGPLVIDDVLVGVVSFGIMKCLPGYPSAFTRVASFLPWIAKNAV